MVLLLPQERGQLAAVEKTLSPAMLQEGLDHLSPQLGEVFLPRFKMTLHVSLLEELLKMGMQAAPFTHIARGENLGITDVIHKAFIDVDEVGTEAAAATAVIVGKKRSDPFSFRADHPYLFLIRDLRAGSILFLGA